MHLIMNLVKKLSRAYSHGKFVARNVWLEKKVNLRLSKFSLAERTFYELGYYMMSAYNRIYLEE